MGKIWEAHSEATQGFFWPSTHLRPKRGCARLHHRLYKIFMKLVWHWRSVETGQLTFVGHDDGRHTLFLEGFRTICSSFDFPPSLSVRSFEHNNTDLISSSSTVLCVCVVVVFSLHTGPSLLTQGFLTLVQDRWIPLECVIKKKIAPAQVKSLIMKTKLLNHLLASACTCFRARFAPFPSAQLARSKEC